MSQKQKVSSMCGYFGYSRAAYYKSLKERECVCFSESLILEMIFRERCLQPRLGGKKLYRMPESGIREIAPHFGRDKFFDLLRRHHLLVDRKRQYRKTTNSCHHFHKYCNLVRDLSIDRPNRVWAADITYLRTDKGFVYLSLLTDMYSRKIVGWELSENLTIEGSLAALKKALKDNPVRRSLIHHSDRGVQYCSHEYVKLLKMNTIDISMTEDSHCYENALAGRVNGILKDEYLPDATFRDFAHAKKACRQAVDLYNKRRPHLSLMYKTPWQVHHGHAA
jgi:transposase InsO family protein